MRSLESTTEITNDSSRKEVLRAWIDGGLLSIVKASDLDLKFEDSTIKWWAMILSDVVHHVIDAIVLDTDRQKEDIRSAFVHYLSEVIRSDRGTRKGKILTEEGKKDLAINHDSEDSVEMVRIFHTKDSVHVIAYVGMWLKSGDEEATWSNILYDIAAMISESSAPEDDYDSFRSSLLEHLLDYVESPTTESYTGKYRNGTEPGSSYNSDQSLRD